VKLILSNTEISEIDALGMVLVELNDLNSVALKFK
jgi:hypothetical protein